MTLVYIGHCIYFNSISFLTPHCLVQMQRSRSRTSHGKQLAHGWRVLYNQLLVYDTMYTVLTKM